jgi:hypothetical protein
MRGFGWGLAILLTATPSVAQDYQIKWAGAGWYLDQAAFITYNLYGGPYASEAACMDAKAKWTPPVDWLPGSSLACHYHGQDPDSEAEKHMQ